VGGTRPAALPTVVLDAAAVHWGYRCELPAAASALEFPLRDAGLRPRGAAQSSSLAGFAVPDSSMGDGLGRSSGLRHYRHPSSRRARAVISSAAGPLRGVDASLPGAPTAVDQSAIFGAQAAPKFYKLEFPTYDGSVDPLNWLNQCEQFFRGQQTMASQRTWLASYHMKGAAQTWYYALEQDEGMPHWERFRELCSLRFGPAVQGTRLAELARLPFLSTVQDYSERYNAVLCHARDLSPRQKAELYVGGLPDQIKVHVEMRTPRDLQSAMYLARAFERCVAVPAPPAPQRGNRPPQR